MLNRNLPAFLFTLLISATLWVVLTLLVIGVVTYLFDAWHGYPASIFAVPHSLLTSVLHFLSYPM